MKIFQTLGNFSDPPTSYTLYERTWVIHHHTKFSSKFQKYVFLAYFSKSIILNLTCNFHKNFPTLGNFSDPPSQTLYTSQHVSPYTSPPYWLYSNIIFILMVWDRSSIRKHRVSHIQHIHTGNWKLLILMKKLKFISPIGLINPIDNEMWKIGKSPKGPILTNFHHWTIPCPTTC